MLNNKHIDNTPLTIKEEKEIWKRILAGDESAKEELFHKNLRIVYKLAYQFNNKGTEFDDIVQDGCIGLLRAMDSFDVTKGFRFFTYAYYWIKKYMWQGFLSNSRNIKLPEQVMRDSKRLIDAETEFLMDTGETPTDEQLADITSFTVERVRMLQEAMNKTLSIDIVMSHDKGNEYPQFDILDKTVDIEKEVMDNSVSDYISLVLENLSEREQGLIKRRHGFENYETHTFKELGEFYKMSPERARQLTIKTEDKIRRYLISKGYTPNKLL